MTWRAVLAWDLLTEDDARLFLTPLGLPEDAFAAINERLPCRAIRYGGGDDALCATPLPPSLVRLTSPQGTVLAGPTTSLVNWLATQSIPPALSALQALHAYAAPPPPTRLMGILNVTPDSFSDGGQFSGAAAVHRAFTMADQGAEIIDIGGESTRPGATPVDLDEELRRTVPVIAALRRQGLRTLISVDTRHHEVAERALNAGADMVNDISALADPAMAKLVAAAECPVLLMHMRGTPETMQQQTVYDDLLGEIATYLAERALRATEAGIRSDRILLDPGFGFGKSARGNEELLRQLGALRSLGHPLAVGMSRKNFIGARTGVAEPQRRVAGSLTAAAMACLSGAAIVRAHDIAETKQALAFASALRSQPGSP